jgi:small-conductance mechanosensitive channel
MFLKRILLGAFLSAFLAAPAFAANADVPVDHTRLVNLYTLQLQGSKDPSLARRIETERNRVRGALDDQVNDLINALSRSATGSELNVSSLIAQQRTVVAALTTRRDGTVADLDLLDKEKVFYLDGALSGSGATDIGRITSSEADLLARKAVFEEQQKSLDFFLSLENDRLGKLQWQQRLQQFSTLITILRYLILFMIVVAGERIIRLKFLTRIHSQNARYVAMKLFTGFVYAIALLWIVVQVSAQYPGILTSVAILGAGVAIALQDVFKDIVGWVVIVQKRLYALGHRVTIGAYTGDVVDISLLSTTLLEVANTVAPETARGGQVLSIPNAAVLTQPVLNYSTKSDYVDAELNLTFTFDSDIALLEEMLRSILNEETQQYTERARRQTVGRLKQFYTSHEPQGSRVYFEAAGTGIRAALRFPVPIGERRIVTTRLLKRILIEVAAISPKVNIAADPHIPFTLQSR